MAVAVLARERSGRLRNGHPWIYAGEIERWRGEGRPGEIVEVVDHRGRFIGRGYYNPASVIAIRLLTRREEPVDDAFWLTRLREAGELRLRTLPGEESYRLIFSEADGFPGLVVDRFGDFLVLQSFTLGMDRHKETIADLLMELYRPEGIFERSEAPVREREGIPAVRGPLRGRPPGKEVEIREGRVRYRVDPEGGQKTGHFFDQRLNREAAARFAKGRRVLDAFAYTGGFGLNAALAGAEEVLALEVSPEAAARARENAALNGVGDVFRVESVNAFDHLRALAAEPERFGLVILDPPAFAKKRGALEGALRGYKEINLRAMKLLEPGGILVSASCSQALDRDLFRAILAEAAADAHRRLRLIEGRGQAPDHPILPAMPESDYLKCFIMEVR